MFLLAAFLTLVFASQESSCPDACANTISSATYDEICGENSEGLPAPCQALDGLNCISETMAKCLDTSGTCPTDCANAISSASTDAVCGDNSDLPSPCTGMDGLNCMSETMAKCLSGGGSTSGESSCPSGCANAITSASTETVCGDDSEMPSPCTGLDGLNCLGEVMTKCMSSGGDGEGCPSTCANAIASASTDDICGDDDELPSGCTGLDGLSCLAEVFTKCMGGDGGSCTESACQTIPDGCEQPTTCAEWYSSTQPGGACADICDCLKYEEQSNLMCLSDGTELPKDSNTACTSNSGCTSTEFCHMDDQECKNCQTSLCMDESGATQAACIERCGDQDGCSAGSCGDSCENTPVTCEALATASNGCARTCPQCVIDIYNDLLGCTGAAAVTAGGDGSSASVLSIFMGALLAFYQF